MQFAHLAVVDIFFISINTIILYQPVALYPPARCVWHFWFTSLQCLEPRSGWVNEWPPFQCCWHAVGTARLQHHVPSLRTSAWELFVYFTRFLSSKKSSFERRDNWVSQSLWPNWQVFHVKGMNVLAKQFLERVHPQLNIPFFLNSAGLTLFSFVHSPSFNHLSFGGKRWRAIILGKMHVDRLQSSLINTLNQTLQVGIVTPWLLRTDPMYPEFAATTRCLLQCRKHGL